MLMIVGTYLVISEHCCWGTHEWSCNSCVADVGALQNHIKFDSVVIVFYWMRALSGREADFDPTLYTPERTEPCP